MTKWELAYSKDDEPCAAVQGEPGTPPAFLFYQLYRSSGDMPDLSLLNGRNADSPRIWSVDPKHSEKGGYGLKDYRLTAERYRDSFGAPVSVVAEYFDRPDCASNPVSFGAGACLVHDCRPGGLGHDLLMAQLAACHPAQPTTLICIDVSGSFRGLLPSVLQQLRESIVRNELRSLDEFICFDGTALNRIGLRSFLESGAYEELSSGVMMNGTRMGRLLDAVGEVRLRRNVRRLILVTDGKFDDEPLDSVIQRVRRDMKLEVTVLP